jgi:hypothetical protein
MKSIKPNHVPHTVRTRDAALRRLGRTNRWLIAGSAVLTGVLTDVAANAFPGHTVRKATSSGASRAHTKHKPLAAPAQAPKPATTSTERAPQPAAPAETTPAETQPPTAESSPAPQATPEPAPAEETPAPAAPEPAPRAEEPSAPVVSGGS